jgi:thioredoxin 1
MEFTTQNWKTEVASSKQPVLVDFWAEWCGPCKMMSPIVDEIAQKYAGKLKVGKLNVDDAQEIAAKFSVQNIPTLLIMKNGKEVERVVGFTPPDALAEVIDKHVQ